MNTRAGVAEPKLLVQFFLNWVFKKAYDNIIYCHYETWSYLSNCSPTVDQVISILVIEIYHIGHFLLLPVYIESPWSV